MKQLLFLSITLCFCTLQMQGQDLHFSQFYHTPQYLNPALIGVFKGDYRVTSSLRSQWASVPVPYQTFAAGGDGKILNNVLGKGIVSGGLQFYYDRAGDISVQLTEVALGTSIAIPFGRQMTLSGGLQASFANRRLDASQITTAAQYNGIEFNPNAANAEIVDNPQLSFLRFVFGANMHYVFSPKSRSFLDFGGSFYNANGPGTNFKSTNQGVKIAPRANAYINSWLQMKEKIDLKGHLLWHYQGDFSTGTYTELVIGSGIRYHLSLNPDKEKTIAFLSSYRLGDALIPSIELGWRSLQVAFSYDINVSDFNLATNRRGGPEFSLVYIFTKPAPPEVFKSCPVF